YKRPLTTREHAQVADLLPSLAQLYGIAGNQKPKPYKTSALFPGGEPDLNGWDMISSTDTSLWIALLAPKDQVLKVREVISEQLLSVGLVPAIEVPALFEDIGPRGSVPHTWEITTGSIDATAPALLSLDFEDSTGGLRRTGVARLKLPRKGLIGAPLNDVRQNLMAGVGPVQPPHIDDPDEAAQIVAWLRLRPKVPMQQLKLSWVGVNAAQIQQLQTVRNRIIGQS